MGELPPFDLWMLARLKGFTLSEIARQLQPPVTRAAVSGWATGAQKLIPERAVQLAALLGEDVSVIWQAIEVGKTRRKHFSSRPPPDAGTSRRAAPLATDIAVA